MGGFDRLASVSQEIEKNPLQCRRVAMDFGQARVEILLYQYILGGTQQQAGHSQRLMERLVDVDWFALEPLRITRRQHLFDQSSYSIDSIQD